MSGLCSAGSTEPLRVPEDVPNGVPSGGHPHGLLHVQSKVHLPASCDLSCPAFLLLATPVIPKPKLSFLSHNYCPHHSCSLIPPVSHSPCQQSTPGHREPLQNDSQLSQVPFRGSVWASGRDPSQLRDRLSPHLSSLGNSPPPGLRPSYCCVRSVSCPDALFARHSLTPQLAFPLS